VNSIKENPLCKLNPGTISMAVEAILSASICLTIEVVHDSPAEQLLDVSASLALIAAADSLGLVNEEPDRGRLLLPGEVARLRAVLQLALDAIDDLPPDAVATLQAVPGGRQ
jgi:hypothetical protein